MESNIRKILSTVAIFYIVTSTQVTCRYLAVREVSNNFPFTSYTDETGFNNDGLQMFAPANPDKAKGFNNFFGSGISDLYNYLSFKTNPLSMLFPHWSTTNNREKEQLIRDNDNVMVQSMTNNGRDTSISNGVSSSKQFVTRSNQEPLNYSSSQSVSSKVFSSPSGQQSVTSNQSVQYKDGKMTGSKETTQVKTVQNPDGTFTTFTTKSHNNL